MSTFSLSAESIQLIGRAALSLALNTHSSSAWNSSGTAGRLYRASWGYWCDKEPPFAAALISRTMDTLSLLNQRAASVRYAHNKEFSRALRMKKISTANTGELLPAADYVRAYKCLQCLKYNMDRYTENENVGAMLDALNDLFVCQIINETAEYKAASWG